MLLILIPVVSFIFVSKVKSAFHYDEIAKVDKTLVWQNSVDSVEKEIIPKNFDEELLKERITQARNNLKSIEDSTEVLEDSSVDNQTDSKIDLMLEVIDDYLGVPYVWGGNDFSGIDCSGFTRQVLSRTGYSIPRVSSEQSKVGMLVDRKSLRTGDLLFFDTTNFRDSNDITTPDKELQYAYEVEKGFSANKVSHVGIYIGNGFMVHASSGDGYVTFADLNSNYYKNRFMNARRIINGGN